MVPKSRSAIFCHHICIYKGFTDGNNMHGVIKSLRHRAGKTSAVSHAHGCTVFFDSEDEEAIGIAH